MGSRGNIDSIVGFLQLSTFSKPFQNQLKASIMEFMFIVLLLLHGASGTTGVPYGTFRTSHAHGTLTQVTIDTISGDVYTAGDNKVYKLTSGLSYLDETTVVSGSILEDVDPPYGSGCTAQDVTNGDCQNHTTNIARVLEIHPEERYLLYCGTINYGICSVNRVDNELDSITQLNGSIPRNLLGSKQSTVAFFGSMSNMGQQVTALYSGVSYDHRPLQYSPMAVSAKKLVQDHDQKLPRLDYVYENSALAQRSGIDIDLDVKKQFIVTYVHGFQHQGFTYFVVVQNERINDGPSYNTRLIRTCQGDPQYYSYTELTLDCKKLPHGDVFQNRATAATVSKIGIDLGTQLGFDADEDVLFVTFGMTEGSSDQPSEGLGSSICMYSMTSIRHEFLRAQKDCYSSKGRILKWINDEEPRCEFDRAEAPEMTENFCGKVTNVGIGARYHLMVTANVTTEDYLATSIAVVTHESKTIAFVGTTSGHLLKILITHQSDGVPVMLDSANSPPYSLINLNTTHVPIAQDMEFDEDKSHLYVLAGNQITKIPTRSCAVYNECSSCVMTDDPLGCGWCGDHCSTEQECQDPGWRSDSCPPVIHSFSPRSGPVDGDTRVVILGENFGTPNTDVDGVFVTVTIDTANCTIKSRNLTTIICHTGRSELQQNKIRVTVKDHTLDAVEYKIGGQTDSQHTFHYMEVRLSGIEPLVGPKSGSTRVTLTGENLDIGLQHNVLIVEDYLNCEIQSITMTSIVCVSPEWIPGMKSQGPIRLIVDGARMQPSELQYSYKNDPVITDVAPMKTVRSGGTTLTVSGSNFHIIKEPKLVTEYDGEMYETRCKTSDNGTTMSCDTVDLSMISLQENATFVTSIYFLLDGVEIARNFRFHYPELSNITYYPDPVFYKFTKEILYIAPVDGYLVIQGKDITLALRGDDIDVEIGGEICVIEEATMYYLVCQPTWPKNISHQEPSRLVRIQAGNIVRNLGYVIYQPDQVTAVKNTMMTYIVAPILGVVALFFTISIICCMRCKHLGPFKRKTLHMRYSIMNRAVEFEHRGPPIGGLPQDNTLYRTNTTQNPYWPGQDGTQYHRVNDNLTDSAILLDEDSKRLIEDAHLFIQRDSLLLMEVIGQGHFGCVHRGLLQTGDEKQEEQVAVKTLKSLTDQLYVSTADGQKFIDEALRMREFDHPNILRLIGVSIDRKEKDMPLVVLPFMKHGDLLTYIRNENNTPTVKELMDFGIQIAEGMAYLSRLKFVHRDLAARNCMLGDDMVIKVADFGLSRDIYERDYYSSEDRKAKLPVKWMALESLEKGIYDTKTDVWSYGVVLWELMTRGVCPYPEVDGWDMIKYLKSGRRMLQPSYCPNNLYMIMHHCWSVDERHRPTFDELVSTVRAVITDMEHKHNDKVDTNITYINIPDYIPMVPEPQTYTLPVVRDSTLRSPEIRSHGYKQPMRATSLINPVIRGPLTPDEDDSTQGYLYPCSTFSQPGSMSTLV